MRHRYPLIIEGSEGNYCGYFPDLPGCATAGRTIEEIKTNGKEAALLYLEVTTEKGEAIPEASQLVCVELVEIDQIDIDKFACEPPAKHVKTAKR